MATPNAGSVVRQGDKILKNGVELTGEALAAEDNLLKHDWDAGEEEWRKRYPLPSTPGAPAAPPAGPAGEATSPALMALMGGPQGSGAGWAEKSTSLLNPNLGKRLAPPRSMRALTGEGLY